MKNVVLVGMPGCGKSTLGVLAAKALMMDFVDTDLILQRESGKPLQQMVNELGTAGFSEEEERCICRHSLFNAVIATGGSVAMEEKAMAHLSRNALVVFIRLRYETVERRLRNIRTRGIAMEKGQTLRDLYDFRQPFYERWADAVLDADGMTIEETVEQLVELVQGKQQKDLTGINSRMIY